MDIIKPLFTITATAIGGRNGHSETTDKEARFKKPCFWVTTDVTIPAHL
jgi:hypothetical protein